MPCFPKLNHNYNCGHIHMVLYCLDLDCKNDFHSVKLNYVYVHLPYDLHRYLLILFAVIFEAVAIFAYLCMYV